MVYIVRESRGDTTLEERHVMTYSSARYPFSAWFFIRELEELASRDARDFRDQSRFISSITHLASSPFLSEDQYREWATRDVEAFIADKHGIAVTISWQRVEVALEDWLVTVTYNGGTYAN